MITWFHLLKNFVGSTIIWEILTAYILFRWSFKTAEVATERLIFLLCMANNVNIFQKYFFKLIVIDYGLENLYKFFNTLTIRCRILHKEGTFSERIRLTTFFLDTAWFEAKSLLVFRQNQVALQPNDQLHLRRNLYWFLVETIKIILFKRNNIMI